MSAFFKNFVLEKIAGQILQDSKILEIGCGSLSLFEDTSYQNVAAIDISVDKILSAPHSNIKYFAQDFLNNHLIDQYDLIVDSHFLHCLQNEDEHVKALKIIYNNLNSGGIFISETMVQPIGEKVFFPKRLILETIEIEKILIDVGFKIKYFLISSDLFFEEGSGTNKKCDLLRIKAQKQKGPQNLAGPSHNNKHYPFGGFWGWRPKLNYNHSDLVFSQSYVHLSTYALLTVKLLQGRSLYL